MLLRIRQCLTAGWLIGSILAATNANADLIKLSNGGEIRGKIQRRAKDADPNRIVIETLTGAEVVVELNQIQFVTQRRLVIEEYETRKKLIKNTLEGHLEFADWCRRKRLQQQRVFHLQRVLEFDPDYAQAHYGLGHTKRDGKWMSRDEVMKSKGLVKHKGKYITPEELVLLEKTDAERKAEQAWFQRIRVWHGWLSGRNKKRRTKALAELNKIDDSNAVVALVRFLGQDKNKQVRRLQVEILGKIPGEKSVKPLVYVSLSDSQSDVRRAALEAIKPELREKAFAYYVGKLTNSINVVVRRAATALGRIGDREVVPDLINALVTRHRYKVRVQGSASPSYSFSTDGSFGGVGAQSVLPPEIELQLRTGQLPYGVIVKKFPMVADRQTRLITVQRDHKNREVLSALVKLTGQNFGYDERTWKLWWTAERNSAEKSPKIP